MREEDWCVGLEIQELERRKKNGGWSERVPENHKAASHFQVFQRETAETDHTNHTHIRTLWPQHLQRYNFTGSNYCGLRHLLFSLPKSQIAHALIYRSQVQTKPWMHTYWIKVCKYGSNNYTTVQQWEGLYFYVSPPITMTLFFSPMRNQFSRTTLKSFIELRLQHKSLQISCSNYICMRAFLKHFLLTFAVANILLNHSLAVLQLCFVWLVCCIHPELLPSF